MPKKKGCNNDGDKPFYPVGLIFVSKNADDASRVN